MRDALTHGRDARDEAYEHSKRFKVDVKHRVLDALLRRGLAGATDHELAAELVMIKDTVAPARNALMNEAPPRVINSGEKRLTPNGRRATVWIAIDVLHARDARCKRVVTKEKGGHYKCYLLDTESRSETETMTRPVYRLIGTASDRARADAWQRTGDESHLMTSTLSLPNWRADS